MVVSNTAISPIDMYVYVLSQIMSEMHGPEATKVMRTTLGYTGAIIGVVSNAVQDDITLFTESGANAVLTRPLTPQKFYEGLRGVGVVSE